MPIDNLPAGKLIDAEMVGQTIGVAIVGALWVWYLRASKRVKSTFVM
ncbi:MAG: DUF2569 family protein [Hyphomicrobiaceae bacterium]